MWASHVDFADRGFLQVHSFRDIRDRRAEFKYSVVLALWPRPARKFWWEEPGCVPVACKAVPVSLRGLGNYERALSPKFWAPGPIESPEIRDWICRRREMCTWGMRLSRGMLGEACKCYIQIWVWKLVASLCVGTVVVILLLATLTLFDGVCGCRWSWHRTTSSATPARLPGFGSRNLPRPSIFSRTPGTNSPLLFAENYIQTFCSNSAWREVCMSAREGA